MNNKNRISIKLSYTLLFIVLLSSCVTVKNKKILGLESDYCTPPIKYNYSSVQPPIPTKELNKSRLYNKYSYLSIITANATGVLKDWEALDSIKSLQKTDTSKSLQMAYIDHRQKILSKLFLVNTEIMSISAELDCEAERAEILANYLTEIESKNIKYLTMLSLTTGAIASIITVKSNGDNPRTNAVAFTGASLSAVFGIATLFTSKNIKFHHERNLLNDIWTEDNSAQSFPPDIWYMLTEKDFSNRQEFSIAHNLRDRWIKLDLLGDINSHEGKEAQKLYFGPGGIYNKDNLRVRSNMLEQVEAAVELMNQDIQDLILKISY